MCSDEKCKSHDEVDVPVFTSLEHNSFPIDENDFNKRSVYIPLEVFGVNIVVAFSIASRLWLSCIGR